MRKCWVVVLGVLCLAGMSPSQAQVADSATLLGQGAPDFSLPSQQGKLVQYKKDFYGKYNLILTFFPAAFTPV